MTVSAGATLIPVGQGNNTATVSIEWSDGYVAEFLVSFAQETVTSYDLMAAIDGLEDVTMVFGNFGTVDVPNYYLDGVTYDTHSNIGYQLGENWWHQWSKDAGGEWAFGAGMSATVISDGDSEGWIYGRAGTPVPEPATLLLLSLGGVMLRRKKA